MYSFLAGEPPEITQHPNSQSVATGGEITFKIEATGDCLTFQWQKNGSDMHNDIKYSGTDTNMLCIQQVDNSDEGCYKCRVKNWVEVDGVHSEEARLTVCKHAYLVWYHYPYSRIDTHHCVFVLFG